MCGTPLHKVISVMIPQPPITARSACDQAPRRATEQTVSSIGATGLAADEVFASPVPDPSVAAAPLQNPLSGATSLPPMDLPPGPATAPAVHPVIPRVTTVPYTETNVKGYNEPIKLPRSLY